MVVGKWRELDAPGCLEIDLVSHSGEVATGEWSGNVEVGCKSVVARRIKLSGMHWWVRGATAFISLHGLDASTYW